jgi:hypothetical protein
MIERICKRWFCAPEVKILLEKMQNEPEEFGYEKYTKWREYVYKSAWVNFTVIEQWLLHRETSRMAKKEWKQKRDTAYANIIRTLTDASDVYEQDSAPKIGFPFGAQTLSTLYSGTTPLALVESLNKNQGIKQ